jgi:arylsulfatase
MASPDEPESGNPKRLDRRALLLGAAAGAAGAAVVGAGLSGVRDKAKSYLTPAALPEGEAARIARSFQDSRPATEVIAKAPVGAPNIVIVLLDDVGFGDLGCYGGEIRTPAIDALAASGLRYGNFRTCAMCSPTRAALLTGLNHHSAGMGWLADIDSGYPGYRGDLTRDAATLAEVLRDAGWSTLMVGKWHVNSAMSTGANGPYTNWPTHRGFERAYWFQGHSTDYFKPSELFDGVAPVEPPDRPDYFARDDFTDRAIEYIRTQKTLGPDKPFYLHVAFPGPHSPLQARARERDAYRGAYDAGWDAIRAQRLARQRNAGLVPETTSLPPLSFGAQPWDSLSAVEKRVYARYMEVYAALVSNVDANIARLLAALDDLRIRDNTLVLALSDNGGSAEGTPTGTPNIFAPAFGRPIPVDEAAKLHDIMGEEGTFPHYPIGWANASNTPYRMYKQYAHLGGVADPLIVSWPKRIAAHGEVRQQFVHVIDLFPTLLEAAGVARPETYLGHMQKPVEGKSVFATFGAKDASTRTEQYFELSGNRAYLDGKWRLVTRHERGTPFEEDVWELYDLATDPNELVNLADKHKDVVAALLAKWVAAAERHNVFPLDDRNLVIRLVQDRQAKGIRPHWEMRPPIERLARDVAPIVCGLSHTIEIEFERSTGGGDGVLVAQGSKYAGFVLYVDKGHLVYEQSLIPWVERFAAPAPLPGGPVTVRYVQTMRARPFDGDGALFVNGTRVAEHRYERVLFSTSYDGFSVGADLGNQVSTAYRGPNPFQGTIRVVRIDVDGSPTNLIENARFLKEMGLRV